MQLLCKPYHKIKYFMPYIESSNNNRAPSTSGDWPNTDLADSKVHEANMGTTWVLLAPDGPHVGPTNLAIRGLSVRVGIDRMNVYQCANVPRPIWGHVKCGYAQLIYVRKAWLHVMSQNHYIITPLRLEKRAPYYCAFKQKRPSIETGHTFL